MCRKLPTATAQCRSAGRCVCATCSPENRPMPLKLSLKPGEKFVLNGAVVQNGDRRSALLLQNKASVLREKDIMQVEDAKTPSRRIYFPVMMMYLDQGGWERYQNEF